MDEPISSLRRCLRPGLTSRLVLLRNLGSWQFAPTTLITYPTAGSYLYEVQAADFNQDQWPDLVLRNHCEIHVLLNDQHGGFINVLDQDLTSFGIVARLWRQGI